MTNDLDALLDGLTNHVKSELDCKPDVVDKDDDLDVSKLPIAKREWHRADDIVAVFADLKNSTHLGINKHAASTASIYEAATGAVARIFDDFGANYIDIQGDGAFGLYWGERRMERALCAGITVTTFSKKTLVPALTKKWPELPETGFKVGVATSAILVKRVGVPGKTAHQDPVWAGKAVNYAAKCAQQADSDEMIVTGSVWDSAAGNDYIAVSCPCHQGPSTTLWEDVTIAKIHESDEGEREGRKLTSVWCSIHGAEYCTAILDRKRTREDAHDLAINAQKAQLENSLRARAMQLREARRARNRGLRRFR